MMQRRVFRNTFLTTLLAVLLGTCLAATALAGVNARLERDRVYEGDPVILIIETDGRQQGEPDLAALDSDFRVLGSSTSTQVRIINGRRSDKTSWTVQLEPRHKGKLRIPPVSVGSEQTRALEVEVTDIPEQVAAAQSGHAFLEVEIDNEGKDLYIQQQIPYTVRLYYDDRVISGELGTPEPQQAVVEQLGEDTRYSVTRNGKSYNVIERRYAISAEKSGPLQIPPVSFRGQLASARNKSIPGSRRGSLLERFFGDSPFANDPFFSSTPFATPGQALRIRSKAISIDVLPRPASAGNTWLPAEQLTLQDSWTDTPPQFRAGEPVTRTITLQAKGLSGAQLPELQLEQPALARLYPESPLNESRTDGETVYGISRQTFTYIPEVAGTLTIPAIELGWWNTGTNQADSTRLPQWEINVEPGSGASPTPPPVKTENSSRDNVATTPVSGVQAASPPGWYEHFKSFRHWPLAGAALLLLMIVLFAVSRARQARQAAPPTGQELPVAHNNRAAIKKHLQQLERACSTDDARAAAQTLLGLGHARWPDEPPRNLGALADRLGEGREQIMALDRTLYASDNEKWHGAGLWHAVRDAWRKRPAETETTANTLKPLYPEGT
ncbi:MAG: BatD family protein [Gammaproteobacteria bacterium]